MEISFDIKGAKELQNFCKLQKLQYHTLKNNIGIDIDETMTNSKKIHAKNTIRCKLTIM